MFFLGSLNAFFVVVLRNVFIVCICYLLILLKAEGINSHFPSSENIPYTSLHPCRQQKTRVLFGTARFFQNEGLQILYKLRRQCKLGQLGFWMQSRRFLNSSSKKIFVFSDFSEEQRPPSIFPFQQKCFVPRRRNLA